MAWPRLRSRRGGAQNGARSHGAGTGSSASGGRQESGSVRPAEPADYEPAAPAAWEADFGDVLAHGGSGAADAAETDGSDLLLWDWAAPGDDAQAAEAEAGGPAEPDGAAEPGGPTEAAGPAEPPATQWTPVVTPAEEVSREPRRPGIGQHRGNLAHLSADPRKRAWQLRAVIAVIVMVAFSVLFSWRVGLTLAVIAVIADTIYRSRRSYYRQGRLTRAQRRTRRQLAKLRRAGYRALHAGLIPGSEDHIDHLVIAPAGVYAIDSEAWDRRLPVRVRNGRELWHGRHNKKERLEHARWESQRAAELLSGETGKQVIVRPALAVYGPKILWDVVTIRDVDVFSGPRLRKYLRRRARQRDFQPLSHAEIERIYKAANAAFPHLSPGSPAS